MAKLNIESRFFTKTKSKARTEQEVQTNLKAQTKQKKKRNKNKTKSKSPLPHSRGLFIRGEVTVLLKRSLGKSFGRTVRSDL